MINRRDFLKILGGSVVGAALVKTIPAATPAPSNGYMASHGYGGEQYLLSPRQPAVYRGNAKFGSIYRHHPNYQAVVDAAKSRRKKKRGRR